jgi:type II secretory ATPase GspE/PulE/Tfp pilus assembly ATPase PilB-like protein
MPRDIHTTRAGARIPGLGDLLLREGMITQQNLDEALAEQRDTRERLGEILYRQGRISRPDLLRALSDQLGHRLFDPGRDAVEPAALEAVPIELARRYNLLPVRLKDQTLTAAVADPLDVEALDQLERLAGKCNCNVELLLAAPDSLERLRENHYSQIEGSRDVIRLIDKVVDEVQAHSADGEELDVDAAERSAQEAGVVSLVNRILAQAVQERATDIHIEPLQDGLVIRFRVDGLLYDALKPPRAVYTGTVSRIKILANMDIAERRAAQDGRFTHHVKEREVDVRASAIPTIHGEKLVLRLLDKTGFSFSMQDLGFSEADRRKLQQAIRRPYGMILLSGPTGSGKTTTLYSSLLELRSEELNITTVEDPVEYQMARINQVQVNPRKQVTFANALRYFLRQDPDVIMVGEIRDGETAEIAVRAALTGHLVFSTIHANDAAGTVTRLISMGSEPFMAASALTLVAAQRLVRRNCPRCLEEYQPEPDVLLAAGFGERADSAAGIRFRRGSGCAACRDRGFQGREAVTEMMSITPEIRQLVAKNHPAADIRHVALEQGMHTLWDSGLSKVREGITTVEEVLRVCLSDE